MGMLDRILMGEPIFLNRPSIGLLERILMGPTHIKKEPVAIVRSTAVRQYSGEMMAWSAKVGSSVRQYSTRDHVRRIAAAAPFFEYNQGTGPARAPLVFVATDHESKEWQPERAGGERG